MENKLKSSLEHAKRLFEEHSYEACKIELQNLLNANYEVATCQYYLGLISLNLKDYDDAAKVFSNLLKNDPRNYNCLFYLGVIAEADKNKDLALRYYNKTLNVMPGHAKAIEAIKRLDGQSINLDSLHYIDSPDNNSSTHDQYNHPINDPPPITESNKSHFQLYDQLLLAQDENSQIAVKMIKATQMIKRKPRMSAFIGSFFFRVIIVPLIVTFFYYRLGLPFSSAAMYMGGPENTIKAVYIITTLLCLIYTILKIKSTIVTIDKGFIQIKRGVFSSYQMMCPIYKLTVFMTHQSFINQITGDCTLILGWEVVSGKSTNLRLKGLGKIDEINELKENLQSLRIQLRNTPVIKSGIYG